jgi:glutamate dehydrogenase
LKETAASTGAALVARAKVIAAKEPDLSVFIEAAVHATDPDDLSATQPDALEAILRGVFERLGDTPPRKSEIHITPSPGEGQPLVIDVVSPDMPFIVDSVLAAVRAAGGSVRLLTHPVLFMSGDGEFSVKPGPGLLPVSILHIEADPLSDLEGLRRELETSMDEVARAVRDWRPMLERLADEAEHLRNRAKLPMALVEESIHFLAWLAENNFIFLGMREYKLVKEDGEPSLSPVARSGLGILDDPSVRFLRSGADYVEMTPQHIAFIKAKEPLLVTKANVRARVHRRVHMDYVGIKLYAEDGSVTGELRVVGLFTSQALAEPHSEVPIIRRKIVEVMRRSNLEADSHASRALLAALDTYPRDELFQISIDELSEYAHAIAGLYDRPRVRVLPRIDRFDNFVSILVYVPRDRYDADVRARIADYLAERYDGRVSAFYPHFPEGDLVRLHVIIGRNGGRTPRPSRKEMEAAVDDLSRSFGDRIAAGAPQPATISDYREAFSPAYESRNTVADALNDIGILQTLTDDSAIAIRLRRHEGRDGSLGLKFYHRGSAIPLSDRVPMLEHFGFRVIDERTYTVTPRDRMQRYIHDMELTPPAGIDVDPQVMAQMIERALIAVWYGEAESDGFNALTIKAGLAWDDVSILRALARYLRQVGISFSQRYLAQVAVTQHEAATAIVALFHALHDPKAKGGDAAEAARAAIARARDAAKSLDEDRILARFHNLVEASLRTNFFQRGERDAHRPALAIKFDCELVEGLPAPRPYREIFVYSPRVEGVHLRFGAIARGGLRWSDRPEDFRTEVLGLVKAQQVKNAVIVPVGAKGGFVPKRLVTGMPRDARIAEGTESYKIFVASLLDLTDNLVANEVVPPQGVVRRDGDDPYLVVAADKGTASFSDTANAIAVSRDYWLGDAFASGGSAGYDHKEMGITARGGWEAVKRHFREMDRDIQKEPFTVAGVGDMSGDVFGNGMLLSPEIRLVAAFDHRDIFLDPDPDPKTGFAERKRLFETPRSTWQDYDTKLISKGGGVFPRSLKSVPIGPELRGLLGLTADSATPAEVMSAILAADVDLMWFGGIGTYIRASNETDADAGDRANDTIRIDATKVRAKVIGEGANLGVTQRGRVEFALAGGRINTDAIDNSAGVNSSDLEVNIKIALGPLLADGSLKRDDRNAFLAGMTEEVAALCLRNNYLQTLALSLAQRAGLAELPDHRDLMIGLEERGLLDRKVEFLPDEATIAERAPNGQALTRPELAVILAYAKLTLYGDLLAAPAPDNPYLAGELFRYFPEQLKAHFPDAINGHRLKREVIATVLANAMVNRGGPAFVSEMMAASSAGVGEVALAYAATRDVYSLTTLNNRIDALDGQVPGAVQLMLYGEVEALLRRETLWFLRNADMSRDIAGLVERHAKGVSELRRLLPDLLPPAMGESLEGVAARFTENGVPADLARAVAELQVLAHASDVVLVSERIGASLEEAAHAFFGVFAVFSLWPIADQGRDIILADRFDRMALDRSLANLTRAQRDLTADILAAGSGPVNERLTLWETSRPANVERTAAAVAELTQGTLTVSRLSVAAGLLADLAREV